MTTRGDLFGRVAVLQVGTVRIRDLRMAFRIDKRLTKEPNTLDLQVFNLSETTRRALQQKSVPVKLIAGYKDTVETLFEGDSTIINHTREGPDWITRVQSGDGIDLCRSSRCSESFAKGTTVADAALRLARRTGLKLGNFEEGLRLAPPDAPSQYTKGVAFCGPTYDILEKVCGTLRLGLSVQDGALQVHQLDGTPVGAEIVRLAPDTGLVGSPEMCEEKAASGVGKRHFVKVRALIQQRLLPGRRVQLDSVAIKGIFRVEKATFIGDTHDTPWYADLEMIQSR